MKYVDEFRDPALVRSAARRIAELVEPDRHYQVMEVCGGHTQAIYRHGLHDLLPENLELVHGPGCPVCVLPTGRIDAGLALAERDDVILAMFGDMMRVPGSGGTPLQMKARGAAITMVYSPLDALEIARSTPEREVVFFAIGFETTAPSTAMTLARARELGVRNFSVFCNHVTIIPAIRSILDSPDLRIDAFIGPGHVSTVIGIRPYDFVARDFRRPLVLAGFEPVDILQSLVMILEQLRRGEARVENQYARVVRDEGNRAALAAMADCFELRPHFEWRGMGSLSQSALRITERYAAWDAERRFTVPAVQVADPEAAQCGEVLRGVLRPEQCQLFGTECTPETPIGALMVSSEGACASRYHFGGHGKRAVSS